MVSLIYILIIGLFSIDLVVYFGYPLIIHWHNAKPNLTKYKFSDTSRCYHIIPLYNEENTIDRKIENCLSIQSRLPIQHVFILDKSTDNTKKIINSYVESYPDAIVFLDKGYRKGKNDSINYAIHHLKPNEQDLLFFSDANTLFENNTLDFLVDELEKGYMLVGGAMKYYNELSGTAKSEGLYWRYEEWIRRNEAKLGKCIVVNGGNFAMLAGSFEQLPLHVPNDFEAPLRICGSEGYVGFCDQAIGNELAVADDAEEMSRKRRMGNRQMSCIIYLWPRVSLLTKLHVVIRKVLRWSGFHFAVIALFLCLILFFIDPNQWINQFMGWAAIFTLTVISAAQLLYYFGIRNSAVSLIHHIVSVHMNSFKGAFSSVLGQKVGVWNKAESNR